MATVYPYLYGYVVSGVSRATGLSFERVLDARYFSRAGAASLIALARETCDNVSVRLAVAGDLS